MAKKSAAAEKRYPKPRGEDERSDDLAPPDRADQIQLDPNDEPEEISIFEGERGAAPAKKADQSRDDEGDGEGAHVVAREERTRTDEGTVLPARRDDDAEDRSARRAKGRDADADEGGYSKKVQRRINREIALRKRSDARLAEERTARQQVEQRLQKLERVQVDEQGAAGIKDIEAKMREVAGKLAEAKEANDTKKEVELQIELGDLQGQKVQLQAKLDRERADRTQAARDAETRTDTRAQEPANKGRSAEWIRAQRRWWSTSRWAGAHDDAIQHDTTILSEIEDGELDFEPYSEEHLEELSRRLKTDYPDLEVRTADGEVFEELDDDPDQLGDDDDRDDERRERMGNQRDDDDRDDDRRPAARRSNGKQRPARAPMGGLGGRDGRRERNEVEMARRGKVTLTEQDFADMRVFKLDPGNPEHKKYYARERARTLLKQANNGAQRR